MTIRAVLHGQHVSIQVHGQRRHHVGNSLDARIKHHLGCGLVVPHFGGHLQQRYVDGLFVADNFKQLSEEVNLYLFGRGFWGLALGPLVLDFLQPAQRHAPNVLGREEDVELPLQCLLDLHSSHRVHSQLG